MFLTADPPLLDTTMMNRLVLQASLLALLCLSLTLSFTVHVPNQRPFTVLAASRREILASAAASLTLPMAAARATDGNPFDAVRYQLQDPSGGVAYMQKCIDDHDFTALLEFTKQYDQVLRKGAMGQAKKTLPKSVQDAATSAANAVTFDLIGINRSSRKGQENVAEASKYLEELRADVQTFLQLEGSVE